MRRFWAALNGNLRGRLVDFGDIRRLFSKICTETFKKNVHNPKQRRPRSPKKIKSCFFKYSVSQDISNAGCKEPKYQTWRWKTSAAKTWLCIWTKNTYCSKQRDLRKFSKQFFRYNWSNKPTRAQKPFEERTQRRFGKFLFRSRNKKFFTSIRYHKTSQTQDGKSQCTNRSLLKPAQAKPNTAVEQK